ncbi:hypothetical protein NE237_000209 [Protea cynaroides]|uniref:Uncharacterized protein n=1 Tax=Protea cynaroides TaxID=273540 RepID=A0A9Q0QWZ1_9MAGN|nr:hypothetical protein NE237_000209 [Protea cynaroides]
MNLEEQISARGPRAIRGDTPTERHQTFASKSDEELAEKNPLCFINLINPVLDCMGRFQTFKSNIHSVQMKRDKAVRSYKSQVTEFTSMSKELQAMKEQAAARKQKAEDAILVRAFLEEEKSILEKSKEESDKRAIEADQRAAESKRKAVKVKKKTLDDFRHELTAPTFWKDIHLLCNYVRKNAGDDFDFSKFEFDVDASPNSKEVGSATDQQIEDTLIELEGKVTANKVVGQAVIDKAVGTKELEKTSSPLWYKKSREIPITPLKDFMDTKVEQH